MQEDMRPPSKTNYLIIFLVERRTKVTIEFKSGLSRSLYDEDLTYEQRRVLKRAEELLDLNTDEGFEQAFQLLKTFDQNVSVEPIRFIYGADKQLLENPEYLASRWGPGSQNENESRRRNLVYVDDETKAELSSLLQPDETEGQGIHRLLQEKKQSKKKREK